MGDLQQGDFRDSYILPSEDNGKLARSQRSSSTNRRRLPDRFPWPLPNTRPRKQGCRLRPGPRSWDVKSDDGLTISLELDREPRARHLVVAWIYALGPNRCSAGASGPIVP